MNSTKCVLKGVLIYASGLKVVETRHSHCPSHMMTDFPGSTCIAPLKLSKRLSTS
jgi:hypothetical protein